MCNCHIVRHVIICRGTEGVHSTCSWPQYQQRKRRKKVGETANWRTLFSTCDSDRMALKCNRKSEFSTHAQNVKAEWEKKRKERKKKKKNVNTL